MFLTQWRINDWTDLLEIWHTDYLYMPLILTHRTLFVHRKPRVTASYCKKVIKYFGRLSETPQAVIKKQIEKRNI